MITFPANDPGSEKRGAREGRPHGLRDSRASPTAEAPKKVEGEGGAGTGCEPRPGVSVLRAFRRRSHRCLREVPTLGPHPRTHQPVCVRTPKNAGSQGQSRGPWWPTRDRTTSHIQGRQHTCAPLSRAVTGRAFYFQSRGSRVRLGKDGRGGQQEGCCKVPA